MADPKIHAPPPHELPLVKFGISATKDVCINRRDLLIGIRGLRVLPFLINVHVHV